MRVEFYERLVDGRPVVYFKFDWEDNLRLIDKPAEAHEKLAYPDHWTAFERKRDAAKMTPPESVKAPAPPAPEPVDPGEAILQARERAAKAKKKT